MKEPDENKLDDFTREWTAKIEFLIATADKANTEQKAKYFEYIDSLKTKQQNLQGTFQELNQSSDLS